MKILTLISDKVNWAVSRILAVMVICLFGINLYGIFFRYALHSPLPWPVPISRILLVWIALIGISVALKKGEHVAIEGVIRALPARYEKLIRFFGYFLISVWLGIVIWQGWLATLRADQLMMISANIQIKFMWRFMAVPISGIIQFIHVLACPGLIEEAMKE